MRWLDRLERYIGFMAIPQFPLFIAAANGIIYFMAQAQPAFVGKLVLDPELVRAGEWWRVFTFLFVPPSMNILSLLFWLLILYQICQTLERTWGEFQFQFFYFIGAVTTALGSLFLLQPLGNGYLNLSLFLAFATLFPDQEYFIFPLPFPIKVKFLAGIAWLATVIFFISGSMGTRMAIGASLTNYFLFFGMDIWKAARLKWEVYQNRRRFKS